MCNILFAIELDRRLAEDAKDAKDRVKAVSLHPGVIKTELVRDTKGAGAFMTMARPFLKSIPQGAATTVFAALSPDIEGGKYYADCALSQIKPHKSVLPLDKSAARLWELSEKFLSGEKAPEVAEKTTEENKENTTEENKEKKTQIIVTEATKEPEKEIEPLPEKEKQDIVADITTAVVAAGQEKEKELAQEQAQEQESEKEREQTEDQ